MESFDIGSEEPNTYNREHITCPHCGYEDKDSWEYRSDDGKITCHKCNKSYYWFRRVDVSYETEAAEIETPLTE